MTQEFNSYKAIRQRKINDICRKMRKAKSKKRASLPLPEYPVEITENCFEITVKRYINGQMVERNYFLDGIGNAFVVWDDIRNAGGAIKRGTMGQQKSFKLISSDFPRIRKGVK